MKNILAFSLGLLLLMFSCNPFNQNNETIKTIDFSEQKILKPITTENDTLQKLNVAVSAIISPRETFVYYEELLNYISEKLNYKIEFKQRKTYKEVNQLLAQNEVDLAFICSGAYVLDKNSCNLELLVVPLCYGKPLYQSYIIVHKLSPIKNFNELKGKTFAFTDPLSNSGKLYAEKRVKELGFKNANFFTSTVYSSAHDISMQLISKRVIDGACVDGLIYEYMAKHYPESISQIKIIEKSEYFGIPPVVVPANLNKKMKEKIKYILLTLHADPKGKKILEKLEIDKFIEGKESDYNEIKEMVRLIDL